MKTITIIIIFLSSLLLVAALGYLTYAIIRHMRPTTITGGVKPIKPLLQTCPPSAPVRCLDKSCAESLSACPMPSLEISPPETLSLREHERLQKAKGYQGGKVAGLR